ncbi:rod-determining factor RdfA [Halalkalicoccus ordinarius]|uniref:rod-determining factor RdfA n=1 Tax=Halalkalicoccus ordinarius TaxID=3116651 RepID=UPI00300E7DAC
MSEPGSSSADESPTTKVARLLQKYGFDGLGDEIERRWTGQTGKRDSLRTLADLFNQRILQQAMENNGMQPLEGEVENVYELLTGDDVTSGTRTETETRLRQRGIDIEELRGDFVTYQAIRTYLKGVRGVEYNPEETDSVETARASFDRLVGRTTAVVEQKLRSLASTGKLTLGAPRVRTTVSVYCEECETQYDVTALLARGGCDCEEE